MRANELLKHDFIIPLLFVYFTDHDVLTRLLITCQSIKRFLFNYRIQNDLEIDLAFHIAEHYSPAMITKVYVIQPQHMNELARFSSLTSIEICDNRELFDVSLVPASVTHMTRVVFDGPFDASWFPASLTSLSLTLDCDNRFDLYPNTLPPLLKSLTLTGNDCGPIVVPPGFLPSGLTELDIDCRIINDLDNSVLPMSLVSLTLRSNLESKLIAPDSWRNLTIAAPFEPYWFPVGLPPNLESFETTFDDFGLVDDSLPIIEEIEFPASLKRLLLYQQVDGGVIPHSVTDVTYHVQRRYNGEWTEYTDVIPHSVTHLDIIIDDNKTYSSSRDIVPSSVTHLTVDIRTDDRAIEIDFIPSSVTHLTWGSRFDDVCGMSITNVCVPVLLAPCACGQLCQCPRVQMIHISSVPATVTHLLRSSL